MTKPDTLKLHIINTGSCLPILYPKQYEILRINEINPYIDKQVMAKEAIKERPIILQQSDKSFKQKDTRDDKNATQVFEINDRSDLVKNIQLVYLQR